MFFFFDQERGGGGGEGSTKERIFHLRRKPLANVFYSSKLNKMTRGGVDRFES